ncbi:hypothetical protein AGMMS4957_10020 [Bacteroidia bacterium]|nr:hypothetical protein AGMMS4957_10020 [Bacteroidia bacterium]
MLQAQVKLSFNPDKGATYSYLFKMEQTGKQTINGQEIPLNTSIDMLSAMTVKEKSSSEVSVDYVYKELTMSVVMPMMSINYDSKKPADDLTEPEKLIAQILGSLIGKTLNTVFAPDGSVKSISGWQEIMADMQKSLPPMAQQMSPMLLQSFNDEAMKKMFEQSFKFYPQKAVKAGDSWTGDFSFAIAGISSDTKNTYTLKSVKNNTALIDVLSVMSGDLSGDQTGEITLDIKTGLPTSAVTTQTIKNGKLNMQGVEIIMDMVSKTTMSLQK